MCIYNSMSVQFYVGANVQSHVLGAISVVAIIYWCNSTWVQLFLNAILYVCNSMDAKLYALLNVMLYILFLLQLQYGKLAHRMTCED